MYFLTPTNDAVTSKDIHLFLGVCILIKSYFDARCVMGDQNPKSQTVEQNCHSICRAISCFEKELTVADGRLIGLGVANNSKVKVLSTTHSWLITPDGAIIDPYPIGILSSTGVIMVPVANEDFAVHGCNLYLQDKDSEEKQFDIADAWIRAQSMARILRKYTTKEMVRESIKSVANH